MSGERDNKQSRSRNIAAIVALASVPGAILLFLAEGSWFAGLPDWVPTVVQILCIASLAVLPIAAIWALVSGSEAKAREILERGDEVIARWTIKPKTWDAFLEFEKAHAGQGAYVGNLLDKNQVCPPEGFACVADRDSVMIGSDFHSLRAMGSTARVSYLAGPPAALEVEAFYMQGGTVPGPRRTLLRVPLGDAHKAARDLHAGWLQRAMLIGHPSPVANPAKWRNIALAVLLAGIAMFAYPMSQDGFVQALEGQGDNAELTLLFIPAIFMIAFGLGFALRFHLAARRHGRAIDPAHVIARWPVDAATWSDYLALDKKRRGSDDVAFNLVNVWRAPVRSVTATADAVQIGDEVFPFADIAAAGLTGFTWVAGKPACIEVAGRYQARVGAFSAMSAPSGDAGSFTLLIPVPREAEAQARTVLTAWKKKFEV